MRGTCIALADVSPQHRVSLWNPKIHSFAASAVILQVIPPLSVYHHHRLISHQFCQLNKFKKTWDNVTLKAIVSRTHSWASIRIFGTQVTKLRLAYRRGKTSQRRGKLSFLPQNIQRASGANWLVIFFNNWILTGCLFVVFSRPDG